MKQDRFLGIQLYSVRDAVAEDFAGTLKALAEMGYDGVELAGLYGHSAEQVKQMAADAGLQVISAHVGLAEFRNAGIEETVKLYRRIGCSYLVIPHLATEDRPDSPTFAKTVEDLNEIARACKREGLLLLYHNHYFEFASLANGKRFLEALLECVPDGLMQTELDTCWVHIVGEDPAALLRTYTGQAPLVHLKDYRGDFPASLYTDLRIPHTPAPDAAPLALQPVGYGVQDIPSVIRAAWDAGASWLIVEQDDPSEGHTPMQDALRSLEYVRSVLHAGN